MSHTTESGAINSGAINHLSFPGSEAGLSLVQLAGDVSAIGSISGISVLLTASATTTGRALPPANPGILIRHQAAGSTVCVSTGTASVIGKIPFGASTIATSTPSAIVRLTKQASASIAAVAQPVGVSTLLYAPRSATQPAQAVVAVNSINEAALSASTQASAQSAIVALRRISSGASTQSAMASSVSIAIDHLLSAGALALASASAASLVKFPVGASTTPTASGSVTPGTKVLRSAIEPAAAISDPVLIGLILSASASTEAIASASSGVKTIFNLSASAVATWAGYTVAFDYSITPAPDDRQMVVPLDDRRMEVDQ